MKPSGTPIQPRMPKKGQVMRSVSLLMLAWLPVRALFVQESRAEDYTRWHLPEGALARLGKGSIGWGDGPVAYSPDGARLAVATSLGIWLYDADTGAETALFTGHTDDVNSVAFSPDGTTLASGSGDGTVLLWDMSPYVTSLLATAIDASPSLPGQTALLDNYPNPFNSRTRIAYRLAAPGPVRLSIYNALGQPVRTLVDGSQAAGAHRVTWDARDGQGAAVSSGVYVTRLEYPGGVQTRRLVHVR